MEKQCKGCGEVKRLYDFYKAHKSRDSRMGKCKECVKAMVKANRLVNLEYYQEFDRKRANNPERVAARLAYQKTDRGREAGNRAKRAYTERNQHKKVATESVANALRNKRIRKLDACEHCGSQGKLQAHHSSYAEDMRLCVTWFCIPCHARLHKEHREHMRKAG